MSADAGPSQPLEGLFSRANADDAAAREALFGELYDELHRLAESHLRKGGGSVTLSATTLVHEAYIAMSRRAGLDFPDERRFFAYASRAMRSLVVDYVRERRAQKRGGDVTFTVLDGQTEPAAGGTDHVRISEALELLAKRDADLAQLVDLKVYCGLNLAEIAAMRGVSERTLQRDWAKVRVLLHEFLFEY